MAALTIQGVNKNAPLTPSFAAADVAGDTFANNGRVLLYFKNSDASSKTVTVASLVDCNQGFTHDISVTVPATDEVMVGFFEINRFNDTNQNVSMTYDDVAGLTVAAIQIS